MEVVANVTMELVLTSSISKDLQVKMASSCPPNVGCGTTSTGRMNEEQPSVADGAVCFL